MRSTGAAHHNADSESLQADVMRFMAIIAFCLIAILALVRTAAPPPEEPLPDAAPADPVAVESLEPVEPDPVVPTRAEVAPPVIDAATPTFEEVPQPIVVAKIESPEPTQVDDDPIEITAPEPDPAAINADAKPSPPAPASPPDPEPGLSLRFVTDGDFLRLISKGDVTVFALRSDEVLGLGQDYEFREMRAPKKIYELHPDTIPSLVSEAFARSHADASRFTWGISLPVRIESQIRSYLDRVESGVLLIDRFGDVRHVGAS